MIKTKEELKTKFETGDKPTQQDFIDLFDTLSTLPDIQPLQEAIGRISTPGYYQPANSPVYLSQGQEVTINHPAIVNEQYQIQVSQEIAGVSGLTNISVDFAQAAEITNYIQEDSLLGTDFLNGVALLHSSPDINPNVKGLFHFEDNLINDGVVGGSAVVYGTAAKSTNRARFGSGSLRIPGGDLSGLRLTGSNYSGSIYTIEFNFFIDALASAYGNACQIFAISNNNNPIAQMTVLKLVGENRLCKFEFPNIESGSYSTANSFLVTAWNKCIIQTNGLTWACWINGVKVCSHASRGTVGCNAGASQYIDIGLGSVYNEVRPAINIDEVRITIGQNLYNHNASTLTNSDVPLGVLYPTAQSYYVMTNDQSHFSFLQANKIQSLTVTYTAPTSTSLRVAASFDERQTWKKWNGVQWVATADFKTDNNTVAELQMGFADLTRTTEEFVDLVFILATTDSRVSPSIDLVTITYQDNSHYEIASIGSYSSTSDFGIKRVDPNTTIVKRLNDNAGKAFITMTI